MDGMPLSLIQCGFPPSNFTSNLRPTSREDGQVALQPVGCLQAIVVPILANRPRRELDPDTRRELVAGLNE